MKRLTLTSLVLFALVVAVMGAPAIAQQKVEKPSPQLVISQFRVTSRSGQFFLLYNASEEALDMGAAQLVYYNHYDLSEASSSKVISLSGELPAGGYYLVNDGPYDLCYKMSVNSASLHFSSTKGSAVVQTLQQESQGQPVTAVQHDYVSWSRSAEDDVLTQPEDHQSFLRQPVDAQNQPQISTPGGGSWIVVSPNKEDSCQLETVDVEEEPEIIETSLTLLPSTPPPVTVLASAGATGGYSPLNNDGLMAPVINELLANPGSPYTDADDEFIEIYNPNGTAFDLSGFTLSVGLDSQRTYTIREGTVLEPQSFTAFYSDETNVALANSGSKVSLLDPSGKVIDESDEYISAKEDQAWALASGKWLATTSPTPGKKNIISGERGSSITGSGNSEQRNYSSGAGEGSSDSNNVLGADTEQKVADIHPTTLAGVTMLAVGYGAYEYRTDVINKLRQFRANRKNS